MVLRWILFVICASGIHSAKSQCNPGHTGPDGGPCTPCSENTFKSGLGSSSCTPCPSNSISIEGSTNCMCAAGWMGWPFPMNVAHACGASLNGPCGSDATSWSTQWAPFRGNDLVLNSGVSTVGGMSPMFYRINLEAERQIEYVVVTTRWQTNSGMIDSTVRVGNNIISTQNDICVTLGSPIVQNTTCGLTGKYISIVDSSMVDSYLNVMEFEVFTTQCQQCPTGKYKDITGPNTCTNCPPNVFSLAGSTSLAACTGCMPGYFEENIGECTACPAGTYKSDSGVSACISYTCPVGQFSSDMRGNTAETCSTCPSSSVMLAGGTGLAGCVCVSGTYQGTHVFNVPYALRTYSTIGGGNHIFSLLDDSNSGMAWIAEINQVGEWMQMDAGEPMYIHGIFTQGRGSSSPTQWVTRFEVQYRLDNAIESAVTFPETFTMASAKQEHVFSTPVYARYVRIVVLAWNNHISMRTALIVKSCSLCPSNAFSEQGSTSVDACECLAGAYTDATAIKSRAMALVPGRAQFSTLANRNARQYESTAQFNSAMGPPGGAGATTFDRDMAQYIDGGSHTFDIATNGGFTIVGLWMFTGRGTHAQIIDCYSSVGNTNSVILRRGIRNFIVLSIFEGENSLCDIRQDNLAVHNTWQEYVVTYDAITNILELRVDNMVLTQNCPVPLTDMVFNSTKVGISFTGRIAGLYMVDALLPKPEISATLQKMHKGEDVLQPCSSCVPGTYGTGLGQTSISACVDCEQGKHSMFSGAALAESCTTCPAMSSAPDRTTCQCNDGFSGNDVASCAMCAAGKYRGATSVTNWARACGDMKNQACPTTQAGIEDGRGSELAVDGHTCNSGEGHTHSSWGPNPVWWSIDLGLEVIVTDLNVTGRPDEWIYRTENYTIFIGNNNLVDGRFVNNSVCVEKQRALSNVGVQTVTCDAPISGRYVFFMLPKLEHLSLCEVEIFSSDCALCPINSMSLPGSVLLADCKCDAGYTGPDGGLCEKCGLGTYKSDTGSAPCQLCPAGTYGTVIGARVVSACTSCQQGTYSEVLGANSNETCMLCPTGKYIFVARANSVNLCVSCANGKYSDTTMSGEIPTCVACAPGKYLMTVPSNNALDTCIDCPAGTFNSKDSGHGVNSCRKCKKGTYNSNSGSDSEMECTQCPEGKFHRITGVTSVDRCKECTCK